MPIRKRPALESVSSRADEYFIETFGKDLCYKWANSDRGMEDFVAYFNSLNPYTQISYMTRFLDHVGRAVATGDDGLRKLKVWLDGNAGVYNEETRTHRPKGLFKIHDTHVGLLCNTTLTPDDMHTIAVPTMQPDAKGSYIFMMEKEKFVEWMSEMIATGSLSNDNTAAVENWLGDAVKKTFAKFTGRQKSSKESQAERERQERDARYQKTIEGYINDPTTTISMVLKYWLECTKAIGHFDLEEDFNFVPVLGGNAKNKIQIQMKDDQAADPEIDSVVIKDFNGLPYGLELKNGKPWAIVVQTKTVTVSQDMAQLARLRFYYGVDDIIVWPVKRKALYEAVCADLAKMPRGRDCIANMIDSDEKDDFIIGLDDTLYVYSVDCGDLLTKEDEMKLKEGLDWFDLVNDICIKQWDVVGKWADGINPLIKKIAGTNAAFIDVDGDKFEILVYLTINADGPANESEAPDFQLTGDAAMEAAMKANFFHKANFWMEETLRHQFKYKGKKLVYSFIDMCTRRDDVYKGETAKNMCQEFADKNGYKLYHSGDVWFTGKWNEDDIEVLYVPFKTGKCTFSKKLEMTNMMKKHRVQGRMNLVDSIYEKEAQKKAKGAKQYYNEQYGVTESWLTGNFQ